MAYLRRYKAPAKADTAKAKGEMIDDVAALSILRAKRNKPVRTIASVPGAAGIKDANRASGVLGLHSGHEQLLLLYGLRVHGP